MKKTIAILAMLVLALGISSVQAQTRPKLNGHTFTNSLGETLDFYDDGTVLYHAEGASISRKGDWTLGEVSNIGSPMSCRITVNIYVSERTVTKKGHVEYYRDGQLLRVVLDGTKYEYSY